MNDFWKGETHAIVKAMKATGNRPGVIAQWKQEMEDWAFARPVNDPDAQAVRAWLPHWEVRPFYTAEELAPMWPALAIAVGHSTRWPAVPKSARRLEFELDYADLPRLDFGYRQFFVVERIHHWPRVIKTEEDFRHAIAL
jgi:hypothetical protein